MRKQPEPEPVAWRRSNWSGSDDDYVYRDYDDPLLNTKGENVGEPLYTAPPKREWVGLTNEERNDCLVEADPCEALAEPEARQLMEEVESKLKEKNNG